MLNETNITIEVSKVIVYSSNSTYFEILSYATPIIAIIITGIIAYNNIKSTSRNTFIQMNKSEIVNCIKILRDTINTGIKKDISDFIDSENSIYLPKRLRTQIKERLENESDSLKPETVHYLLDLLSENIFAFY